MTKQKAGTQLQRLDKELPYGSKAEIARKLRISKHNVQTAFRGMAGEKLTLRVLREAQKIAEPTNSTVPPAKKRATL